MHTPTKTHDARFTATSPTTPAPTTEKTMTPHKTTRRSVSGRSHSAHPNDELRASQLPGVAADEIAWFYTSYDHAPSSRLARYTIAAWLSALDPAERRTLCLRFDVSPWAEDLKDEGLESGLALAVNLVSTARWHAKSGPRSGPHDRARKHLETAIRSKGIGVMRDIGRRADWDFASAVRAYARVRGRSPSVLPRSAA
jgi:hypothetical protein